MKVESDEHSTDRFLPLHFNLHFVLERIMHAILDIVSSMDECDT